MILLDTNVMSELMRAAPDPAVLAWLRGHDRNELATTSVTVAEVGAGLAVLPQGARQSELLSRWHRLLDSGFDERVMPFDKAAAVVYGELFAQRKRLGRPSGAFDLQIAAIARHCRAMVATRNVAHFEGCGVDIINPWRARAGT